MAGGRESELLQVPFRRTFTASHLVFIHRWLFQDVYDWAGRTRNVPINKGGSEFAQPRFIEPEMQRVLAELAAEGLLRRTSADALPARLAYFFGELNALHPFREGNGRVQRLFLSHVLKPRRLALAWQAVSSEEMVSVSVAVHNGNEKPAITLFGRILRPF